jgi:hypothetical protein
MMNKADTSIKEVKVNREKLLATLKENLGTHKADFETAIAGYRQAKDEKLAQLAVATRVANENSTSETRKAVHEAYTEFAHMEVPQDHSESYELAIEIMSWETETEVKLSINDFQCYVRDKWNWKDRFRASVANYANHSH